MHLSIFNFNSPIIKSIFIALILFVGYTLVLISLKPNVKTFQNQWVSNYSVAEKYLYEHNKFPFVIVGSSMANRLRDTGLDNRVYNLSFSGGSALTGLNIIKYSEAHPQVIFIDNTFAKI